MSQREINDRRREIAREALDCPIDGELSTMGGDPYWLKNMHGRIDVDEFRGMSKRLSQDATILLEAARKIDEGELLPEEAALWMAERVNYGDYKVRRDLYDSLPVEPTEL